MWLLGGEEFAVAGVDLLQRAGDRRVETAELVVAAESRHPPAVGVGFRQAVGLFVGQHLDAVFNASQSVVGLRQFRCGIGLDVARQGEGRQGVQGPTAAQLRISAAQDQLLGLDVELDLADAAGAELQVDALGRDPLVDLVGMDLALDRVDVGDGGEVEVPAPDKGRKLAQEGFRRRDVSGAGSGLDEGGAFPVLADTLVVIQRRGDRHGGLGRSGVGPKPQVHTEDVAVGGSGLHQV